MLYSKSINGFIDPSIKLEIPDDAIEVSYDLYKELFSGQASGKVIKIDDSGIPYLSESNSETISLENLLKKIDRRADIARLKVAGDPLRAVEYERAAEEAKQYADNDYAGEVPPMVAAWVTSSRTARQAADSIIAEAEQYNSALTQLRTVRLQAKEAVRSLMADGNTEQAVQVADDAIALIEEATSGIGNNT